MRDDLNRTYAETVICRWAENKLALPAESVASVTVEYSPARAWSSWTYEDESLILTARNAEGQRLKDFYAEVGESLFEILDLAARVPDVDQWVQNR